MIFSLVYVSSAAKLWSRAEVDQLLAECRAHNVDLGVTGMLLYRQGNIMQLLEGDEDTIRGLFDVITADPRHKDVTMIWSGYDENGRQFGDWTMGFTDLGEVPIDDPAYTDFLSRPMTAQELTRTSNLGLELLQMFRKFR